MTALTQYDRLEADGRWSPDQTSNPQDVVVSFGKATLVISDTTGAPLAHWSLPAVARLNPRQRPASFAPDTDATELLEIEDTTMIEAIETVRKSLARNRPQKGRLRGWLAGGATLAIVAALALWLPDAMRAQTLAVVPATQRSEIGGAILTALETRLGPACETRAGTAALQALHRRALGPDHGGATVILPAGLGAASALPGNIIALDRSSLRDHDDPAILAGHILAADAQRRKEDPLMPVLRNSGLPATLTLLTTGHLPKGALDLHVQALLDAPRTNPDVSVLAPDFAAARIPLAPFAVAVLGEDIADPDQDTPTILDDGQWVSLQGICDGQ